MASVLNPFPAARWHGALYLMVLLAVATFCHVEESLTPLVVAAAVIGVAWLLQDSRRPSHARPPTAAPERRSGQRAGRSPMVVLLINMVVVGSAAIFFYEVQAHIDEGGHYFVTALGHFIITLLLCKMFDRRTARDIGHIVILSLLLVVASTMYSQSMMFALLMAAFFGALIYVILLSYLQSASQDATMRPPVLINAAAPVGNFVRDVRRASGVSALLLLPVAMVVFLTLPRNRTSTLISPWGRGPNATFQTGMSASVQFHDFGQLAQSDEIVMEVTVTQNKDNIGSPYFDPYFRGQTLDQYDPATHQWSSSHDSFSMPRGIEVPLQLARPLNVADLLPPESYSQTSAIWQDYKVRVPAGHLIFTLAPAAGIYSNQIDRVWVQPDDYSVSYADARMPLHYLVVSVPTYRALNVPLAEVPATAPDTVSGAPDSAGTPPDDAFPLIPRVPPPFAEVLPPPPPVDRQQLPEGIEALARQFAGDLFPKSPADLTSDRTRALINTFENYLRTHYPYSLEFRQVEQGLDPTVDFLKNRQATGGHCEFFASAMVMLCRAAGINARMVQGYHGSEYNSISGTYTVRQLHAHAWAEVYQPGAGWIQSDPSPISVVEDDPNSVIKRWARELSQIIQNTWLSSVASFDNDSRRSLMLWIQSIIDPVRESLRSLWFTLSYAVSASGGMGIGVRLSVLGPIIGLIILIVWTVRRWRRARLLGEKWVEIRRSVKLTGELGFLDELLRLIGRTALRVQRPGEKIGPRLKGVGETPREFLERHAPLLGAANEDVRWLMGTFYGLRFGGVLTTPQLRDKVSGAMGRVRKLLDSSSI